MSKPNNDHTLIRRLVVALINDEFVELTDHALVILIQSLDPEEQFLHVEHFPDDKLWQIWHTKIWRQTDNHRQRVRYNIRLAQEELHARLQRQAELAAALSNFIPKDKSYDRIRNKMISMLEKKTPEQVAQILENICLS